MERISLRDVFLNQAAAFLIEEVRNFKITSGRATEIAKQLVETFPKSTPDDVFIKQIKDLSHFIPEMSKLQKTILENYPK